MIQEMYQHYSSAVPSAIAENMEAEAVRQLAFLLLARVDGKSPAEYITRQEDKDLIREVSYEIVKTNVIKLEQLIDLFDCKMEES